MPISPQLPDDRRSVSLKRENDVLTGTIPVITKSAYDAIVRGNGADQNLRMKRFCQVRNLLGQALPLIDALLKEHVAAQPKGGGSPVVKSLRARRVDVERAFLKWPLNIQNK